MLQLFNKAKWIYFGDSQGADEHSLYVDAWKIGSAKARYQLNICGDSGFACFINGKIVGFSQYLDYSEQRVVNTYDITDMVLTGENKIVTQLWHYGISNSTYKSHAPGLIYEITEYSGSQQKCVCFSSEQTASRLDNAFINYRKENITGQLGYNYCFDLHYNHDDLIGNDVAYKGKSKVNDEPYSYVMRPVKNLTLGELQNGYIVKYGSFKLNEAILPEDKNRIAVQMQEAFVSLTTPYNALCLPTKLSTSNGEGMVVILDLMQEQTGYLHFDLSLPCDCDVWVGYGEHLIDGKVRSAIQERNFSFCFKAKQGRQTFDHYIRRLGLRYLQLFIFAPTVELNSVGVTQVHYPLQFMPFKARNLLEQQVYDISARTLKLCMHEHYEDCPWREQAMYIMDSRNQMLCGYFAFKEFEMPRASLLLMLRGQKENGLFDLCFPSEIPITIPSFSLMLPQTIYEYIKYSGDNKMALRAYYALKKMLDVFIARISNGLVQLNTHPSEWNFIEWEEELDGYNENAEKGLAPLNAFVCLAMHYLSKIAEICAKQTEGDEKCRYYQDSKDLLSLHQKLSQSIYQNFYDSKQGVFITSEKCSRTHELTTALCVLCSAYLPQDAKNLEEKLLHKSDWVKSTLSMNCFVYDALIKLNEQNLENVVERINEKYIKMIADGATAFYETEKGAYDFFNAGSLCHGWSAMPVYYYHLLNNKAK